VGVVSTPSCSFGRVVVDISEENVSEEDANEGGMGGR
jgi:hypothetical protein